MSAREICPICAGIGERWRLEAVPYSLDTREVLVTCEGCMGSGFERSPTLRQLKSARENLERANRSMDMALIAIRGTFGETKRRVS